MPNFMCSHNDSAEATGVLNDGHTVDLLQALVHNARTSNIGEAWSSVTGAMDE